MKCNKIILADSIKKEKKPETLSTWSRRKACLMVSTSRSDADGRQGLFHFFATPVALNCSTHCTMLLQEGGVSP
jgi:hypothetical protein